MSCRLNLTAAAGVAALLAAFQPAQANPGIATGTLECSVAASQSFLFGSNRQVECVYTAAGGTTERYVGEVARFGIDVGFVNPGRMIWAVIASTDGAAGALAGNYVGAAAAVTPVIGVGVYALIGGSARTATLQPVSFEGNTGLNLALGVAELRLRPAR